jgi:hypothetical protein
MRPAVPQYVSSDARMTPVDLEAFELVLLRTPENAPAYDDAELERIQAEHLAHHAATRDCWSDTRNVVGAILQYEI